VLKLFIPVIILIIACFTMLWVFHRLTKEPDTGSPKMDALARDAAHLFSDMRVPYTMSQMDEVDLLTDNTKHRVDAWLVRYKREINK